MDTYQWRKPYVRAYARRRFPIVWLLWRILTNH